MMLTSSGDHRGAAREAGVEHMLTKPVRRARLLAAVAEALGDRPSAPAPVPAGVRAPAAPGGARVLVAEDNPVNRMVIEGMLAARGVAVDVAENGREAIERVRDGVYAAVFMDCQMPELDGYAATAGIRAAEAEAGGPRLPIVATTAHAMAGDRERCLQAGMDDYLSKPLRPEELDRVLARWLGAGAPAAGAAAGTPVGLAPPAGGPGRRGGSILCGPWDSATSPSTSGRPIRSSSNAGAASSCRSPPSSPLTQSAETSTRWAPRRTV